MAHPDPRCGELDACEIVFGELLIAGGGFTEVPELVKQALDEVALLVEEGAKREGPRAVGFMFHVGSGAWGGEAVAPGGCVVGPAPSVGKEPEGVRAGWKAGAWPGLQASRQAHGRASIKREMGIAPLGCWVDEDRLKRHGVPMVQSLSNPAEAASFVTSEGRRHYTLLDGLRGIAALCVVVMHVGYQFKLHHSIYHSYMAVPFFFVLSGFVIGDRYEKRLAAGETFIGFISIRLIRLYPLVLIGVGLYLLLSSTPLEARFRNALLGALLLPLFAAGDAFPANPPQWSLFLELFGNAIHALAFRWLSTRRLGFFVATAAAAIVAVAICYDGLEVGPSTNTLWAGGVVFAFSYSAGVLLARIKAPQRIHFAAPAPVVALVLVFILAAPGTLHSPINAIRDILSALVAFPALIALGGRSNVGPLGRKACNALGLLSYPVYVINFPILAVGATFARAHQLPAWNGYVAIPCMTLLVSVLGWSLLKGFDEPLRAILQKQRQRTAFKKGDGLGSGATAVQARRCRGGR